MELEGNGPSIMFAVLTIMFAQDLVVLKRIFNFNHLTVSVYVCKYAILVSTNFYLEKRISDLDLHSVR
ncbi:MAG: hypothetical protein CMM44_07435 [Rhodospirillaceae bacterium]|nr:hypothetical protein [Rhodospirillaceae bacterium]